jgi:hypothetical protein
MHAKRCVARLGSLLGIRMHPGQNNMREPGIAEQTDKRYDKNKFPADKQLDTQEKEIEIPRVQKSADNIFH